jgi:hypothetical protein
MHSGNCYLNWHFNILNKTDINRKLYKRSNILFFIKFWKQKERQTKKEINDVTSSFWGLPSSVYVTSSFWGLPSSIYVTSSFWGLPSSIYVTSSFWGLSSSIYVTSSFWGLPSSIYVTSSFWGLSSIYVNSGAPEG